MKNFFQKIFSKKNEDIRKVITFLGIKIKFISKKQLYKKIIRDFNSIIHAQNSKINELKNKILPSCSRYNIQKNNLIYLFSNSSYRLLDEDERINGLEIIINGYGNEIYLDEKTEFIDSVININTNDNKIVIKEIEKAFFNIECFLGDNQTLYWDSGYGSFRRSNFHLFGENSSITIGKNCLLSDTTIWTSDCHSLFLNNKLMNGDANHVKIGDNCWIGSQTFFTKNASINNNTIVGARAVITKAFNECNLILAGNPADIVGRDKTWEIYAPEKLKTTGKEIY